MTARRAALALALACAGCGVVFWSIVLRTDGGSEASPRLADCEAETEPGRSIARTWNEALLAAIRLDFPAPTVHARNLFHTSAAMWDVWAAYDPVASGVFVDEDQVAADVDAARVEAISFAAYRILVERYLRSPGAEESVTGFDELLADLCFDRSFSSIDGDRPAAFGNRVAATILAAGAGDGANEADDYADPSYEPVNPPLVVAEPGATLIDPDRWQPLELEAMVSQTGIPLTETRQTFIGPHWGRVTPFALDPDPDGLPIDPGPPPRHGTLQFREAVVEVLAHSALLDPTSGETIDIGPAARGNAPIGTYDERGHTENPATGRPYAPNVVAEGDYARVVAEFWADGPASETPPGHWNTLANSVTDAIAGDLRLGGEGPVLDPLEWDVKLYLALNGATHDAAVAAWGAKGHYDYVRPISMIRWMGGHGQSSDPDGAAYDLDGLPLVPGLIEVVSEASSAPGERHQHLSGRVGEVVVRSWRGTPADVETELGGVGWIRAVEWVPYQLPTFVTPSFAGYVSGHSTFSRAAAEVLAAATGSEYFPGGQAEWTVPAGSLEFEAGPDTDLTLTWATYADAADEAGRSRLYGGIHVRADDLRGREMGQEVGRRAWAEAQRYFAGAAGGG